jgi:cbb3-type cytochrome oxidase cytochrome c subunit/cytochrome c553
MKEPGFDIKKLHKVFLGLSVLLFLVVNWIFLDDFLRPWKVFQVKSLDVQKKVLQNTLEEEKKIFSEESRSSLEKSLVDEKNSLDKKILKSLEEKKTLLEKSLIPLNLQISKLNSSINAKIFHYEHGGSSDEKLLKEIEISREQLLSLKDSLKQKEEAILSLEEEESLLKKPLKELEKKKETVLGKQLRTQKALEKTEKDFLWSFRNAPFVNYIDPTIKPDQIILKHIKQDYYFQDVITIDTCKTCHVFIDKKGYENEVQPYKTHSQLGSLVGDNSSHSFTLFGCTSCHEGNGRRFSDFSSAAHRPSSLEQKKNWEKLYGYKEAHHEASPMLPLKYIEASCQKCHDQEVRVFGANALNEGKHIIESAGCYACHQIRGFEHMPKPGPPLSFVTEKFSKNYLLSWIYFPFNLNPKSRMPAFFNQTNQKDVFKENLAEIHSMGHVLWKNSLKKEPLMKFQKGDGKKGQELFESIGCKACHNTPQQDELKNQRGPYLYALGSKINPDWLVSWLKNPKYYHPQTIMPSFRLTQNEIFDLATYLLSFKDPLVENTTIENFEQESLEKILLNYMEEFSSKEKAKKSLIAMSQEQKLDFLAKKSFQKYGCNACHESTSFENLPGIGPELNKIASKPLPQLGFGTQKIEHSRNTWLKEHLSNPRIWDQGVPASFKDRKKMPRFYFSKNQIDSVLTFLLGLKDFSYKFIPKNNTMIAEEGRREMIKNNCYGCHKIAGSGGDILPLYEEDQNLGPPYLYKQGARTKSIWLYDFLGEVTTIRPNIKIRMPSYDLSHEAKLKIVNGFNAESNQNFLTNPSDEEVFLTGEEKTIAKKMLQELICVTCHTQGFNKDVPKAPDLKLSFKRLRRDWIKDWMNHPQKYLPYTSMPNFFENGTLAPVPYLNKNIDQQLELLTKWIIDYGK